MTNELKDTLRHQGMRKHLIEQIIAKGITDDNVLKAMSKVPRHLFMDSSFEEHAYQDKAFPIAANQTISQPYTVAFQSQLLDVSSGMKILEIGTGSGYQTAVLLEMGAVVYTIERQRELFKKTSIFLPKLGYKPKRILFGDGYKGLPSDAPFSRILVTAGAPVIPKQLLSQLEIGGKLVIPVGNQIQIMTRITRKAETKFEQERFGEFRFVPLLENKT